MTRQHLTISIQGYLGSFHHQATQFLFGDHLELLQRDTFTQAMTDLVNGNADYCVLADENQIAGPVGETKRLLKQHQDEVEVLNSTTINVDQNLIVIPGTKLDQIRTVYSHPMAIKQCSQFLQKSGLTAIASADTALSVKEMMDNKDPSVASIAGAFAAKWYEATILEKNIQDTANNKTRFLVIKRKPK